MLQHWVPNEVANLFYPLRGLGAQVEDDPIAAVRPLERSRK